MCCVRTTMALIRSQAVLSLYFASFKNIISHVANNWHQCVCGKACRCTFLVENRNYAYVCLYVRMCNCLFSIVEKMKVPAILKMLL